MPLRFGSELTQSIRLRAGGGGVRLIDQVIGDSDPASGSSASAFTYVINQPALGGGTVDDVEFYSAVANNITFSVYDKSGTTFTQSGSQVAATSSVGLNTTTLNLPIAKGQYVGFTIPTTGVVTYQSGSGQYYFGTLSSGSFSGTLGGGADFQVRFNLRVAAGGSSTGLWAGKRLAFFGDSITSAGTWHTTLCDYLGAAISLNDARSGTMMYDALDNTTSNSFNNTDAAVVFYGTNDYGNNTTLGALADAAGSTTFYAQIKLIIETWQGWKSGMPIYFMTPLYRSQAPAVSAGQTLLQYRAAIMEVAALYNNCHVIDMYTLSGIDAGNVASLTSDGLHPTAAAQTSNVAVPAEAYFDANGPT